MDVKTVIDGVGVILMILIVIQGFRITSRKKGKSSHSEKKE